MKITIDDAGDIPADMAEKYNIDIIPINIMFGTQEYLSGIEIDRNGFYEKTAEVTAENFPKTSQPTPYQFVEFYKKILATGEKEILSITISEKLSGTHESAVLAAKELEGQGTFHIFDSKGGSAVQGFMAMEAARLRDEGAGADQILAHLDKMRDEMETIFTIDSLEYARKGGRVSNVKSVMASLLNIKPILQLENGVIEEAGRVRTRKKAIQHIVDTVQAKMQNRPVRLAVIHANAPADASILGEVAQESLNVEELITVNMSIAVAINLGPGALGLVAIPS